MTFLKVKTLLTIFFTSTLYSQNNFLVETSVSASFKMGSMQSESKILYTEQGYFSKVKFTFRGKGVARLMSRDMHNGTMISFQDSTIKKINFNKKKFTSKTFEEVLEKKKENQIDDTEDKDDEIEKFSISEFAEEINGFEAYKLIIGESNSTQIWFTKKSLEPAFVKTMKEQINKFENNWFDISGDFSKYGIDEDVVIVKFISNDNDGNFDFNLITHKAINTVPDNFTIPENFKKVRKL